MNRNSQVYSSGAATAPTSVSFLSPGNYDGLLMLLQNHYKKQGYPINEPVERRLERTLEHFMKEVQRNNPPNKPLKDMNQETVRETVTSMNGWLQKQTAQRQEPNRQAEDVLERDRLFGGVNTQYDRLQQARAPSGPAPPAIPDFRDKVEETDDDPLILFERAKKAREGESSRLASASGSSGNVIRDLDLQNNTSSEMPPVPQMRVTDLPPTTAIPSALKPQDYLIKQQDIVKYKEVEQNIFINSGDRDWLTNKQENRYNFSVSFNTANNSQSFNFSPSVQERFRNIIRVEAVKVISCNESLEVLVRNTGSREIPVWNTDLNAGVLSFPYISMRIAELNTNNFGTNSVLDNTFAVLQYDATWNSDTNGKNRGYVGLIPKFMKCQRIYHPTPLATLQRLSIRMERPDGSVLSDLLDVHDVNRVIFGADIGNYFSAVSGSTSYSTTTAPSMTQNGGVTALSDYIFLEAKTWFTRHQVNEGDRINVRGYAVTRGATNVTDAGATDFESWVNRPEGHFVVAIQHYTGSDTDRIITDDVNKYGYARYVVIRNRFTDPQAVGVPLRQPFNSGNESALVTALRTQAVITNAGFLNTNHQTHVVLRIITREMDATSDIRPDNS